MEFHPDTPQEVRTVLLEAKKARLLVRIYYGNVDTGRDSLEEYGMQGHIGVTAGQKKVPLICPLNDSHGGDVLSDHQVIRIRDAKTGKDFYRHSNYHTPALTVRPTTSGDPAMPSVFTHAVEADGKFHAAFRSEREAENFVLLFADGGKLPVDPENYSVLLGVKTLQHLIDLGRQNAKFCVYAGGGLIATFSHYAAQHAERLINHLKECGEDVTVQIRPVQIGGTIIKEIKVK